MNEEKLQRFVRLLVEEDYGGYGGYGIDPGPDKLAKAFGLTGLMDIGKTMMHGIEKMSSKAQHLIGVVAAGLAGSLIPFAEGKYEEIDAAERRRSERIKTKYKDVFERVDKEFYEEDFRVASFLYNPVRYISALAGVRAPGAALDVLDTITARNDYVSSFTDAIRNKFNISSNYRGEDKKGKKDLESVLAGMFGESVARHDNLLLEAGLTPRNMMKRILGHEKVRRVLAHSKYIKSMQTDAEKMIKEYVNDVVGQTRKLIQGLSLESLDKVAKGKINMEVIGQLEGNEKTQVERVLLEQAKGIIKKVATKRLTKNVKELPDELKALVQRGVEAIEAL